jgi:hypothetical protein
MTARAYERAVRDMCIECAFWTPSALGNVAPRHRARIDTGRPTDASGGFGPSGVRAHHRNDPLKRRTPPVEPGALSSGRAPIALGYWRVSWWR